MRRVTWAAILLASVSSVGALAACTRGAPAPGPTITHTEVTSLSPSAIPTRPVNAGPTTSKRGPCPLIGLKATASIIGQRLDHATLQTSGGIPVGCTFYPITSGYAPSEHLPKNGFPSARISVVTYPSANSARQVLAIVSRAGGSPSLQSVNGLVAETFQTRFYPPDGAADWACVFIKGPKLITVNVAEDKSQGQSIALSLSDALASKI